MRFRLRTFDGDNKKTGRRRGTDHTSPGEAVRPAPWRRRRNAVLRFAVICGWLLPVPLVMAATWRGWIGTYRDGKSRERGLLKRWPEGGPRLLWKASGLGEGYSSPSIVRDTVYITGAVNGKLVLLALRLKDGSIKWQREHGPAWTRSYPGARSTPTVAYKRVYLLSGPGLLRCYEAGTGEPVWRRSMAEFGGRPGGWGYSESVLLIGDKAFVTPGGRECVAALDARTGKTIWTGPGNGGGAQYSSCIGVMFQGIPMIINGTRAGLFAADARTGRTLWTNPFARNNTANCPTPVYADGYVFWAVGYGKGGICLKLRKTGNGVTAKTVWTTKDMVCHHGGYIIDNGCIYGNNGNGWACLDLRTGRVLWKARSVGKGSLCYADGMLYLFGENGGRATLVEANPRKFVQRGTLRVKGHGPSWAHPVVAEGRLFLRYAENLYCFDVRAPGSGR